KAGACGGRNRLLRFREGTTLSRLPGEAQDYMIEANSAAEENRQVRRRRQNTALFLGATTLAMLILAVSARPQTTPEPTPKTSRHAKSAATAHHAEKRRVISVTLNKGETYTISGLAQGAK